MIWLSMATVFFIFSSTHACFSLQTCLLLLDPVFFWISVQRKSCYCFLQPKVHCYSFFFFHICFIAWDAFILLDPLPFYISISETVFLLFCKHCLDPLMKPFPHKLSGSLLNNTICWSWLHQNLWLHFKWVKDENDQRSCSIDQHLQWSAAIISKHA